MGTRLTSFFKLHSHSFTHFLLKYTVEHIKMLYFFGTPKPKKWPQNQWKLSKVSIATENHTEIILKIIFQTFPACILQFIQRIQSF